MGTSSCYKRPSGRVRGLILITLALLFVKGQGVIIAYPHMGPGMWVIIAHLPLALLRDTPGGCYRSSIPGPWSEVCYCLPTSCPSLWNEPGNCYCSFLLFYYFPYFYMLSVMTLKIHTGQTKRPETSFFTSKY